MISHAAFADFFAAAMPRAARLYFYLKHAYRPLCQRRRRRVARCSIQSIERCDRASSSHWLCWHAAAPPAAEVARRH